MVQTHASCPEPDVLEGIAAGQPAASHVKDHLESCAACRAALQQIRDDNRFLTGFAIQGALPRVPTAEPARLIDIPGYDVHREVHRGGQGVVYQAIQRSTKRECAIKVMRHGPFATSADRARFDREINTLGRMDHANIVAVWDAGATAGCQYFVMDYIDGWPLDEAFAVDSPLPDSWLPAQLEHTGLRRTGSSRGALLARTEAALQVFIKVCDAVHAAHLRGVIHRDLKPSNIRVDRLGEPRVLDFGLAKSTDAETDAAMTRTGQFVGSLPWASPEQVEGRSAHIDLRTDVYSLGAILYQLLAGQVPFDVGSNLREALNNIMLHPPPRPSAVAASTIGLRIGDELDTIVLKCLAKKRDDRYQSAGDLARDLRRYLAGEPIEAKRDSSLYVLRKTLQRYRLRVAVAGIFAILLAVFSVTLGVLYRHSTRLERDAVRSADALAESLTQSNLEQGRMAGVLGNMGLAEDLLWRELLTHHVPHKKNALYLNDPPGPGEAFWALWELYRRYPCLRNIRFDSTVLRKATTADDGELVWVVDANGFVHRYDESSAPAEWYQLGLPNAKNLLLVDARGETVVGTTGNRFRVWRRSAGTEPVYDWSAEQAFLDVSLSRSGKRVALLTEGKAVVWDAERNAEIARFQAEGAELTALAISNDDRKLAGRDALARLCIWDIDTGQCLQRMQGVSPPYENLHLTGEILFSLDDQHLADAWVDSPGRVWDLTADPPQAVNLSESAGDRRTLAFSPDGKLLAVGDISGTLRLFDAHTGQRITAIVAHAGRVLSVGFSDHGRSVWTCSEDELRLWEVAPDAGTRALHIDRDSLHAVCLSPDGRRLIAGGGLGRLEHVDLHDMSLSSVGFGNDGTVSCIASTADGGHIAAASYANAIYIWDTQAADAPPRRLAHPHHVSCVCFSDDGALFATACDDQHVRVWRTDDFEKLAEFATPARVPQIAFDRTGRCLAAAVRDGALLVWNLDTLECAHWAVADEWPLRSVQYAPDGTWLATAGADRLVTIWDTASHRRVDELAGHNLEIFCLCISPDGNMIASGDTGGKIRLWDALLRRPLASLDGHRAAVMALQFAPDSRSLVSASLDETVRIWDLTHYDQCIAGNVAAQLDRLDADHIDRIAADRWRDWATAHRRP